MSMPLEAGVLVSSLPAWNDARAPLRWLVKLTVTHWPCETWSTSGSSGFLPEAIALASLVGTNAARMPLSLARWPPTSTTLLPTSIAVTLNVWAGAFAGQGLPGSVVAGIDPLPPDPLPDPEPPERFALGVLGTFGAACTAAPPEHDATFEPGRASGPLADWQPSTRMMPHAPCAKR